MPANELLGVYLNDHLAGSSAGLELAEKLRDNNQGSELGDVMAALHLEIEQDRKTLEELMGRLEVTRHPVKDAAGWVLERLSRLRLNPVLTGSADLTRLLETEVLSRGIADRAGPRPAPHAGAPPGGGGGAGVRQLSAPRRRPGGQADSAAANRSPASAVPGTPSLPRK